jgi:hypothetical protein
MNENKLFGIRCNETGDTSWFTEDDVYAAAQKGAWEDCTELISVSGHGEVDSDFSDENTSSGYVGEMYLSVWNEAGENITIFQNVSLSRSQVEIEAPRGARAINLSGQPITGLAYDIMQYHPRNNPYEDEYDSLCEFAGFYL